MKIIVFKNVDRPDMNNADAQNIFYQPIIDIM